jgi:hypothetical protein
MNRTAYVSVTPYQTLPDGSSGTNNPSGIRSWKCPITVASLPGIEIDGTSPSAVLNSTVILRVCPETSVRITKFSEHEPD